jgi:putative aldouronate transport system permease protein
VFLWPVGLSFEAYKHVLKNPGIWMAYGNTIFYVVVGTSFSILATTMAAYPLSRKSFCARRFLNFFIVFCLYFSGGLIPSYLLITQLGFYNSRWVMIIPVLLASYYVMICRSAFSSIPEEVMESAIVDGANDIQILFRIAIPLIMPTLAVLILYYAIGRWNNFFTPLLYISKKELQPLQILLRRILIQSSSELLSQEILKAEEKGMVSLQVRYVTIVVSTLPIIMVYPFIQKYFVKGIMLGAVKG